MPHPLGGRTRNLDPARFAGALQRWMTEHSVSQAELARRLSVTQQSVSDWLSRKKRPGAASLALVLDVTGIAVEDVTPPNHGTPVRDGVRVLGPATVLIPRSGFAGGGPPYSNAPEEPEHDPYPRSELMRITGVNPEILRSSVIIGDSHAPEIPPNTRVIWFPCDRFDAPGLYVVTINDGEQVRRVQQLADGSLRLIPSNPVYEAETLTPLADADTPNTYHTPDGRTAVVICRGKVVFYPKPA